MADFKLVIANPKTGKCVQQELKAPNSNVMIGKKIGDKIEGSNINLKGYELEITGGSDSCGFPMRKEIPGAVRKRILAVSGVGVKKAAKGIKQRKTVCGNTINEKIIQINLKVLKEGEENIFKEKEQKEEPKQE
jgi:small subunit ribosomal protein S6e